jgi:nucleotide-binding universal stress UspA family protein
MTRRRIIAPVTFGHETLEATVVAADLAAALGAELLLVGIVPLAPPDSANGFGSTQAQGENQRMMDQLMSERLEELTDALPDGVRWRTVRSWGPVGPALIDAAREQRADLVVVPILRESELSHLVHDRADRYVLHHCDVPVLVVPANGDEPARRP